MSTTEQQNKNMPAPKRGIVDCDVHVVPKNVEEIRQYVDPRWREQYERFGREIYIPPTHHVRLDSYPPGGGPPASDPDFLRQQLMDEYGINYAILLPRPFTNPIPNRAYATDVCKAFNMWQAETWLKQYNHDGVFRGSILISTQDTTGSVREIERAAGNKNFVQVLSDSGTQALYGQDQYYPIYEACEHYDLPFCMHAGAEGIGISKQPSVGYPTHFIEWSALFSTSYQTHLTSMLFEGIFERFPKLKVVLAEGGVAWLPSLLWRLDNLFDRFHKEVPWLKRKPSEYMRDHVRITSQPLERPDKDHELLKTLQQMDAEHILMFSSDYAHWDFDSPKYAFPKLPDPLHRRIFFENAKELYKLP